MTREECWKLVFVIKSSYPKTYERFSEQDFENLCTAMYMCLSEYTYEQAAKGLKAYLVSDTKGFPPVAGQIIAQIQKLNPEKAPEGSIEAWNLVMRAIRNGSYGAEEEFEKLPRLVQKTLGSPQYLRDEAANSDFNLDVAKGQFMKNYEIIVKRDREMAIIAPGLQIEEQERVMING